MKHDSRKAGIRSVAVLALAASVIAGCSSTGGAPESTGGAGANAGTSDTPRATIAMVTHEVPGNAFWDLIRKGAEAAAAKDNIELRYTGDPEAPNQANLVQSALDSDVDGIALTLAKPDAMTSVVEAAIAKNVPVVAFNAGYDTWKGLGVQQYFGQDETIAGEAAGARLQSEGARNTLCIVHEQGNVSLESRCAGVTEGLTGGSTQILNVTSKDMPSVEAAVTAKLQQDPGIDHIVALDAGIALTVVQAKASASSDATVVTFDTNAALVDAIKSGDVEWAIDQQPYLQGYLAVDSLWLYLNNKNTIGGGQAVLTGPSFIDNSNIDAIADLAAAGTR